MLPTAFVTFLLVIFGITFTDSYIEGDDGSVKMVRHTRVASQMEARPNTDPNPLVAPS